MHSSTDDYDQKYSVTAPPLSSKHPPIQTQPRTEEGPWSTGLFGCFDDVPNCCITCWCPCITFGQIAEIVDKGAITCGTAGALYALIAAFTGCACCFSCLYRSKLRKQYMLNESPCGDWLVHCCCESCALCQEYRQLKNQGFDMSNGWKGNLEKQNYGMEMPPVVEGPMRR